MEISNRWRDPTAVPEAIEHIHAELGTATALITHNAVIADIADRVLIFGDGRVVEEKHNAHKPLTALFRQGGDWAAFRVENGTTRTQVVEVGRRNGLQAEILGGLAEGDTVVEHPGGRVSDGSRVVQRTAE